MLAFVIVLNLLISAASFYLAWKIWQLRRVLRVATKTLARAERSTHQVFHRAPESIVRGKSGTRSLRDRYQRLEIQLQRLEQMTQLLNLTAQLWRLSRRTKRSPRRRPRKILRGSI